MKFFLSNCNFKEYKNNKQWSKLLADKWWGVEGVA